MFLRRVMALTVALLLSLTVGLAAASAEESAAFQEVLKERVAKFWVSPNFARDGTVFAITESWPEVGSAPEGFSLHRSTDGGKTWTEVRWLIDNTYRQPEEIASVHDLVFLPDGALMLSGTFSSGEEFLCRSVDSGRRWEKIETNSGALLNLEAAGSNLLGVFRIPRQDLTVLRVSFDGGRTWSDVRTDVIGYDGGLAALDSNTWVAVLDGGKVAVTLDGGRTWHEAGIRLAGISAGLREPGRPVQMIWGRVAGCVEPDGTKTAVACGPGASAQVFISRDLLRWEPIDQAQFELRPKYSASRVISVAAAPGGLIFAGTPDDCVLVSEDYGATWKPVTEGVSDEILDIKSAPAGDSVVVLAATQDGLLRMEYRKQQEAKIPEQQPGEKKQGEGERQPDEMVAPPVKFVVGQKTYRVGDRVFNMDAETFTEDGRTYVPVRYLGDALGTEIKWDGATQTVTLIKNNVTVKLVVGNKVINVNGQSKQMDVAPLVRGGRTYLPARYVAEAFGYRMGWDPAAQTVSVTK
ncbi:stalk domain-containing protein [Desulfofundulus thermosubterraneus]|uniref:BNR repeat-like domain-containing protein n=1 Tax=Desulfofundulus thermosubterraneus DSM 16057 TaxID=1121432 RepID=A0A1M6GZW1_9FIRM|nr:stalk domain-containing protein [Desulfofundulus thermosubterraneus]SHJ15497.1 BNR repeat-like domain-containing protein [Desulfofundulus thermosubterraneus DSM 16057]